MSHENPYSAPQPTTQDSRTRPLTANYRPRAMRWWQIEQLKADMAFQPLTDRECLPYLVINVAFTALITGLPGLGFNLWDALGTVTSIAIAVAGTIYIFSRNGGIDGQWFLQRYFAIGFVVTVRCTVVLLALMILTLTLLTLLGPVSDDTTWYEYIWIAVAEAFIYWRIGHHVGDLAESVHGVES